MAIKIIKQPSQKTATVKLSKNPLPKVTPIKVSKQQMGQLLRVSRTGSPAGQAKANRIIQLTKDPLGASTKGLNLPQPKQGSQKGLGVQGLGSQSSQITPQGMGQA